MKLKRLKNRLKDNDIELEFDFHYLKRVVKEIGPEKNKTKSLNNKIISEITPSVSKAILEGKKKIKLSVEKVKIK